MVNEMPSRGLPTEPLSVCGQEIGSVGMHHEPIRLATMTMTAIRTIASGNRATRPGGRPFHSSCQWELRPVVKWGINTIVHLLCTSRYLLVFGILSLTHV